MIWSWLRLLVGAFASVAVFAGCAGLTVGEDEDMRGRGELLFQSGFEEDVAIATGENGRARFVGADRSLEGHNSWDTIARDTKGKLRGGGFSYSAGERAHREATIVADPADPSNRVVRFWGIAAPGAPKFRIQTDMSSPSDDALKEYACSVRLYVPEAMAALRDYPKAINWLTVAEFWNDSAWTSHEETEHAFRVTVGIAKNAGVNQDLFFRISTDDFSHTGTGKGRKYKQIHLEVVKATQFAIPFGKWMTLDYGFRDGGYKAEGGRPGGLFTMAATPEGGRREVVCSLESIMHSPQNPAPKGVTYWAPMKMYTSKEVAAWMESKGRGLELFYDDLRVWDGAATGERR